MHLMLLLLSHQGNDMQMSFRLVPTQFWTYWNTLQRSCTFASWMLCLKYHRQLLRSMPSQLIHMAFQVTTPYAFTESRRCVRKCILMLSKVLHICVVMLSCLQLANGQSPTQLQSRRSTSTFAVFVQAATSRDMDRAERLCMVFTQFCDYNLSTLGSPSDLVSGALPFTPLWPQHCLDASYAMLCAGQQAQKRAATGCFDSYLP